MFLPLLHLLARCQFPTVVPDDGNNATDAADAFLVLLMMLISADDADIC